MNSSSYILEQLMASKNNLDFMVENIELQKTLERIGAVIVDCFTAKRKIILAGNGGSAADAQHMAGEYISRFMFDRPSLPAIALTTDSSILTAIANDYNFEDVFARQIQAIGEKGDIFIAYSTSGNSINIVRGLEIAKNKSLINVGFTGNRNGLMNKLCDYLIDVPSSETPRIQEGHLILGHTLCGLVEQILFKDKYH